MDKIGKLIDSSTKEERDAIHIAVAPVIAGHDILPGQHIGFLNDDGETVGFTGDPVGIVDPFLWHPIEKGERFWMFLYPNTITSLRHDWTHPAFPKFNKAPLPSKEKSKEWITNWAAQYGLRYEEAIEYGREQDFFLGEVCNDHIPEEFWDHFKVITGIEVSDVTRKETHFRCAC